MKQLFSQWSLKHQLIIYKEYLVLGKLRTIQATEVDFQNRGTGESSHQSGFIQKIAAIFQGFFKNHIRFSFKLSEHYNLYSVLDNQKA